MVIFNSYVKLPEGSKADATKLAGAGLNSSQVEQVENESCSF